MRPVARVTAKGEWQMKANGESAREKLIVAGRRLFAEKGIDAVSLREIVREANVKHATAIQYHFGDRDGLIAAISDERAAHVNTRREAMLDSLEADLGAADVRDIAAALVRPLASELETTEGRYFLRIYAQRIQRFPQRFPSVGPGYMRWRRHAESFLAPGAAGLHPRYSAIAFPAVELARRAAEPQDDDNRLFVSRLIDVVAAIIAAPLSDETKRLCPEANSGPRSRRTERHSPDALYSESGDPTR